MAIADMLVWRPMEQMRGLMESMMQTTMGGGGLDLKVEDHARSLVVTAQLQGFEKNEVQAEVAGRTLTLRARKRTEIERKHGGRGAASSLETVTRSTTLPAAVRPGEAKATWREGTLRVELPKERETQVRKIEIE